MTTNHLTSPNPFPPPHRAPGVLEELVASEPFDDGSAAGGPAGRRYQRTLEGWLAARIRKQSRHWRQR